jgi:hypothetical protein
LDKYNEMIQELIDPQTCCKNARSDPEVKELIIGLVHSFEECMNNDLDVKCAFDDLFESVSRLAKYKEDGKIIKSDCERIKQMLGRIDQVLQINFK